MKLTWKPFLYPPEVGSGSGGGTENNAGSSSGVTASEGSVTSGTASDAMIAAFTAASSAEEGTSGLDTETEADPDVTGTPAATGDSNVATTTGAKGPQVPTGAQGEAPEPRIVTAVKNARAAAVAETEAKFAWAKDLDKDSVDTAFGVVGRMLEDTPKFAAKLAAELGMKLVPVDAPVTAAATGTGSAPATGGFKLPKALLRSEDGQGAYSEEQMGQILESFGTHLEAKLTGQMKPLMEAHTRQTETEKKAAIRAEAQASVNEFMAEYRARPHFMVDDGKGGKIEHPSILRNLQAIPPNVRAKIGPEAAVSRAYNKYLAEEVFPTIGTTAAAQVRDENARKLRGSDGSMHPAGANGSTNPPRLRDGDINGLAAHMAKLAGANTSV
jgi:hypothetical protein